MAKKNSKQASVKAKEAPRKAEAPKKPPAYDSEGRPTNNHLDDLLHEMTSEPEKEHLEQDAMVECPYCGEGIELHITSADEGRVRAEDCRVCSRPISVFVHVEEGELEVTASRS